MTTVKDKPITAPKPVATDPAAKPAAPAADAQAPATATPAQTTPATPAPAPLKADGSVGDPYFKLREFRLAKEATLAGPKVTGDLMKGFANLTSAATNKLFKGAVTVAEEAKGAAEAAKTTEAAADAAKGTELVAKGAKGARALKAASTAAKTAKAVKVASTAAKGAKAASALKDVAPEVAKEVVAAAEKAATGKASASVLAKWAESTSSAAKSASHYFSSGFLDMKEADGLAKTVSATEDGAKYVGHAKDAFRLTKTMGVALHGLNFAMTAYDLGREYQVERNPKSTSTQKWAGRITLAGDALMFTGNPPLMLVGAALSTGGALFRDSTHPIQDIDNMVGKAVDAGAKAASTFASWFGLGNSGSSTPAPAQ